MSIKTASVKRMTKNIKKYNTGTTLLEVLLYIGLFSVISTSTTYLYISIASTTDTFSSMMRRIEVAIYIRHMAEYQLDTGANANIDVQILKSNMQRILRYYPDLLLVELQAGTGLPMKVDYKLKNSVSGKIYANSIYVSTE